jgi:hypothetical protein
MPAMSDEQLAKLPKYARDEIGRLRRNLDDAYRRLEAGPDDSDTFASPFANMTPLGRGVRIRFVVGDEERQEYVDAFVRDGSMTVQGGQSLAITLAGSNSFDVQIRRRL